MIFFSGVTPTEKAMKAKMKWDYNKMLLHSKRAINKNEKATYSMEENISKSYIYLIRDYYPKYMKNSHLKNNNKKIQLK